MGGQRCYPDLAGGFPVRGEFGTRTGSNVTAFSTIWLQASGGGSILGSPLLMMVVVMGIFYVLLILPQQRRQKQHRAMLEALKNGDKVVTSGGIYGTVSGMDGDTLILKIADTGSAAVKIRVARSAIAQVEASEDAKS